MNKYIKNKIKVVKNHLFAYNKLCQTILAEKSLRQKFCMDTVDKWIDKYLFWR